MKRNRKILHIGAAVLLMCCTLLFLFGCQQKKQVYTVGICQLAQHDALDAATQGFEDALKEILGEENVVFDVQNASGDSATCSTIANAFNGIWSGLGDSGFFRHCRGECFRYF